MDQERFTEEVRKAAAMLELPPAETISDEVMEAAVVRAAELLEEMAPPSAAALITRGLELDAVQEANPEDGELLGMTQFQMLGAALFHCVEVLEMISAAAERAAQQDMDYPEAG